MKNRKLKAVPTEQQPITFTDAQNAELGDKVNKFTAQIRNWMKKQGVDRDRVEVNVHMRIKNP